MLRLILDDVTQFLASFLRLWFLSLSAFLGFWSSSSSLLSWFRALTFFFGLYLEVLTFFLWGLWQLLTDFLWIYFEFFFDSFRLGFWFLTFFRLRLCHIVLLLGLLWLVRRWVVIRIWVTIWVWVICLCLRWFRRRVQDRQLPTNLPYPLQDDVSSDWLAPVDNDKSDCSQHTHIRLSCPNANHFLVVVDFDVHERDRSVMIPADVDLAFSLFIVQDQSVDMRSARMNLTHLYWHLPDIEVNIMVDPLFTSCQLLTSELILRIAVTQCAPQSVQVVLFDRVGDIRDVKGLKFWVVSALEHFLSWRVNKLVC